MSEEENVGKEKRFKEDENEENKKLTFGEYMNVFKKDKRMGKGGHLKRAWRVSRVGIVGTPFFRLFLFGFLLILPFLTILFFTVVLMTLLSGGVTAIIALDSEYTDETKPPIGEGSGMGDGSDGGRGDYVPEHLRGKLLFPGGVSRVTSLRGSRWGSFHNGVDMGRKLGGTSSPPITPIYPGEVTSVRDHGNTSWGKTIVVKHNVDGEIMYSRYAHFHTMYSEEGDVVGFNTVLGDMGTTGNSTGIHLHLEIYTSGYTGGGDYIAHSVDPLDVLTCDSSGGIPKQTGYNVDHCVDYRNSVVN